MNQYGRLTDDEREELITLEAEHMRRQAVYFMQHGFDGLIKIGHTNNIARRMLDVQSVAPNIVYLLGWQYGGQLEEFRLHRRFSRFHSHHEWFHPSPEILEYAQNQNQGLTHEPSVLDVRARELKDLAFARARVNPLYVKTRRRNPKLTS